MRQVSWIKAALKAFESFPAQVRENVFSALDVVVIGETPDTAKPLKGFTEGVFELSIAYRTDAWRLVYCLKIGEDIWVVHAFQKKSKKGIKTPKHVIELIRERIKRLKEQLNDG